MTDATAAPRQGWRYGVMLVLLLLGQGTSAIPSPLYALYAQKWDYPPVLTAVVFGSYGLVALGAILLTGPLSDRFGRRPLLIVALALLLAGLGVFAVAPDPGFLVLARMLHGLGVGIIVVAAAAGVLDLSPGTPHRNGTLSAVFLNLGIAVFAIGTAVYVQLGPAPLIVPYLADAVIALALLVLVLRMRDPHRRARDAALRISRPGVHREVRRQFLFAVTGAGAAWAVLGVAFSLEPAMASDAAHVAGPLFSGVLVATLATAAAIAQVASSRLPAFRVAIAGDLALGTLTLVAVGAIATGDAAIILGTVALQGGAYGLAFAGSLRHLTADIPPHARGAVMAAFYLVAYGALIVPTVLVGIGGTLWSVAAIFPVFSVIAAALCLVAVLIGIRLRAPRIATP